MKIIIIEDDINQLKNYKSIFSQYFVDIDYAMDGEEGYNKVLNNNYDVIFTDIRMPKMDGLEMIEKIRLLPQNNQIDIVIISAYNEKGLLLKAINLGITGYLTKPIVFHELEELIKSIQEKHQGVTQNQQLKSVIELDENQYKILINEVAEGMFYFDKTLSIGGAYNKNASKFLGEAFFQQTIDDIFFKHNSDKETFRDIVNDIFKESDSVKQDMLLSLLNMKVKHNKRFLDVEFKYISESSFIIVSLKDITKETRLHKKLAKEHKKYQFIINAIQHKDELFQAINQYEKFFKTKRKDIILDNTISFEEKISEIKHHLHTFKGIFSQLKFIHTPKKLHKVESKLNKLNEEELNKYLHKIKNIAPCDKVVHKDLELISKTIGESFLSNIQEVNIDTKKINTIKEIASKIDISQINLFEKDIKKLLVEIKKLNYKSFNAMISKYPYTIQTLAQKYNKNVEVVIYGEDVYIDENKFSGFAQLLYHILSNAVIHGVETQAERASRKKPEVSKISINIMEINDFLHIAIKDDGHGLNTDKIVEKALKEKIIKQEELEKLEKRDIFDLIFHEDFSTMDEITIDSGRGIGLSTIRKEVEAFEGLIHVNSKRNKGTTFHITLPIENIEIKIDGFDDEKYVIKTIAESSYNFFENNLNFESQVMYFKPYAEDELKFRDITTILSCKGKDNLDFIFSYDEELLLNCVEKFVGEIELDDDKFSILEETISEISNIIVGTSMQNYFDEAQAMSLKKDGTFFNKHSYKLTNVIKCYDSIINTNFGNITIYTVFKEG